MNRLCLGCFEKHDEKYSVCPHCGYVDGRDFSESTLLEPGTILAERYIVGASLGFGGFGVTYIGWDALLEQKVAIKEYLPNEFSTRMPGQTEISVYTGDKGEQFASGLIKFLNESRRLAKFNSIDCLVRIYGALSVQYPFSFSIQQ